MATKAKTYEAPPADPVDPREQRRRNMAKYGTTMTPRDVPVNPDALAAGLNLIASAGLPEPIVTTETISPPEGGLDYSVDIYTFLHIRVPGLAFRTEVTMIANFPLRVIQICKSAGIQTDALAATDDPPVEDSIPDPPPEVLV